MISTLSEIKNKTEYKTMKTTNALRTLAVMAMSALTLVSCDKSKPQMDDKAPETTTKAASSKIAFVR